MAGNTFGTHFKVTTFGESHGPALGCVIDGCPAGLNFDLDYIQKQMDRRRPGQSAIVTQRKEADRVEALSGVFDGRTTGTPIALIWRNEDQHSKDYDHLTDVYRPSHADYTWDAKFGLRDHRGGGRSSARETSSRVAAGAVAQMLLKKAGIEIRAWVSQVGAVKLTRTITAADYENIEQNDVRCPDPIVALEMIECIKAVRKEGDTIGGVVECKITGCPAGLGEPVFDKLHADLAKAMMSINAAKGFEFGSGFEGVTMRGSAHNDVFYLENDEIRTRTNYSGGIQGGISNGMDIDFRVAFKPVATLMRDQETIGRDGRLAVVKGKGRHDPCVVPRAVPIVEAMAALTLADHWLRARSNRV